eukprot:366486-Chlamydomonas_euryale.AAC.16
MRRPLATSRAAAQHPPRLLSPVRVVALTGAAAGRPHGLRAACARGGALPARAGVGKRACLRARGDKRGATGMPVSTNGDGSRVCVEEGMIVLCGIDA